MSCMTILADARSDIRPHIKWAVSLVFAYGHFNIPLGCEWVTVLQNKKENNNSWGSFKFICAKLMQ